MRIPKFVVHREIIGSLKHVLYDSGKISWLDDLVTSEWVFDKDEGSSNKCLKTLLRVNGMQVEFIPGAVQQKVYGKLLPTVKTVPWSLCLPAKEYKSAIKNFMQAVSMMDVDPSYYDVVYSSFSRLISKFQPFKVDVERMRAAFENANDSLMTHLESCLPGENGLVQPPKYDFFGTRTGRLVVSSGPMVLTLPKDQRGIFIPSSKGSRIVQIDFSSLEPRLLSALAKLPAVKGDLYEEICTTCFSGKLTRDKAKVAILGILYGMSVDTLSTHIGMPVDDCRVILATVKKHFKIKELLAKIDRETLGDFTKNFFGKVIELNKSSMLNNYVQSTGVDIAHMGFDKLVSDAEFMSVGFKPMFLVHDALVGEVSEKNFESLKTIVDKGFYCSQLDCVFPLTMDTFAKTASGSE